jgi:hypothetical protein
LLFGPTWHCERVILRKFKREILCLAAVFADRNRVHLYLTASPFVRERPRLTCILSIHYVFAAISKKHLERIEQLKAPMHGPSHGHVVAPKARVLDDTATWRNAFNAAITALIRSLDKNEPWPPYEKPTLDNSGTSVALISLLASLYPLRTFALGVGDSVRTSVRLLLTICSDATKSTLAKAAAMGHNINEVQRHLHHLLVCLREPGQLELSKPSHAVWERLQDRFDELAVNNCIPLYMVEPLQHLLLCPRYGEVSAATLLVFYRAVEFFTALCAKIGKLEDELRDLLDDTCVGCTSGTWPGTEEPAKFMVAIRERSAKPAWCPLSVHDCKAPALLLLDELRAQIPDVPAIPVSFWGDVLLVRGNWTGSPGYELAKKFAARLLSTCNDIAVVLRPEGHETVPPPIFEAVVVYDDDKGLLRRQNTLSCFGGRPMFRLPCRFHQPTFSTKEMAEPGLCGKSNELNARCRLGPGLMIYVCEHRCVYGYHVQTMFESPEMSLRVLREQFPFPPRIIVYDIACLLHRYIATRNYSLFRDTLFVIDRLHIGNHVGCSKNYSIRRHQLDKVNSQVSFMRHCYLSTAVC